MRVYTSLNKEELLARGFQANIEETRIDIYVGGSRLKMIFDCERLKWSVKFEADQNPPRVPALLDDILPKLERLEFTALVPIQHASRRVGFYRRRTAVMDWPTNKFYSTATAETFSDLWEFIQLFTRGDIAPEREYTSRQVGSAPREFRQLAREFWALLRRQMSEWKFRIDRFASTLQ